MATIKSYTDLEQSKKLADILPIESADMRYSPLGNNMHPWVWTDTFIEKDAIPCWSLAALLEQLPYEVCDDDGNSSYLQINKEEDMCQLEYRDPYEDFEFIETIMYENFVDACVAMIEKLHELKML